MSAAQFASFKIVASGAANTSNAVDISQDAVPCSILWPSAFTGTAAAVHGTFDGTNYFPVKVDGAAYTLTFTASSIEQISPRALFGLRSIKLVSNGTEAADRVIAVAYGRIY